jgi:hypothetical protein
MKVLKIMVKSGAIYHMPLPGFHDAEQVELVDMTREEYHAVPASIDAMDRCRLALANEP